MLRFVFFAGLASVAYFASSSAATPQGASGGAVISMADEIPNEPVMLYSLAGSTLAGTLHTQLAVYSSGLATIATQNETFIPSQQDFEDVATAYLDVRDVRELREQLKASGAFTLTDQKLFASDIPLNTLTVFSGASLNHTYSYWVGTNQYEAANKVVQDFIDKHFPTF